MKNEERKKYITNCQKLLRMVGVLYERGYTSIIPQPNFRESTGRWQLFIYTGNKQMLRVHYWFAELGGPEIDFYEFEKSECKFTPEELADRFTEDNSQWLSESLNYEADELFVKWYQAFLKVLKDDHLPHSSLYNFDTEWIVVDINTRTDLVAVPYSFASLKLPLKERIPLYLRLAKPLLTRLVKKSRNTLKNRFKVTQ